MKSYRILFFISSLIRGGAELHLLNLCRFLRSYSHEPAVCTFSRGEDGLENALLGDNITIYHLPLSSLRDLAAPRKLIALRRIVKHFQPDLIHSHLYHAEVVSALASLFSGAPLLATKHSEGLEFEGKRRWMIRMIKRRFDSVIAVSRGAADEAVEMGYPEERIFTVPSGVDAERFHPLEEHEREKRKRSFLEWLFPQNAPEPCLLVGSVGSLKPVKNFPLFARMAARLIQNNPDPGVNLRFVIIGEGGDRDKLASLTRELGINSSLALPGSSDRPEEIYPLFDIFVVPSLIETGPMVLLEAMASGVACVASNVGSASEFLGDTGELVQPGDEEGFVRAVSSLLSNEELRRELGRGARVRIKENFDIDIWGNRILDIYRSILDGRSNV